MIFMNVCLLNMDGSIFLLLFLLSFLFIHLFFMLIILTSTGDFDDMGVAEGVINGELGEIKTLRLHVHIDSDNWAILSEVSWLL